MNKVFFINNRRRLMESLDDALVVLAGYTGMQWHGDIAMPFRQEANFWYLTGIEHADWQLIIDGRQKKTWLIAPEVDDTHQLFDGSLSYASAKEMSGVDEIIGKEEGKQLLKNLAKKYTTVHTLGEPPYAEYVDVVLNSAPAKVYADVERIFTTVKDCRKVLSKLRAIKQPEEMEMMERAARLSVEGFDRAKQALKNCHYEYEVEAELAYHFRRHNAVHAFEPIVASGKNACTLHYTRNSSRLQQNNMVLIDAGASLGGYPADITRTFAVGAMTKRQQTIHEAVRSAHQQIIELIRPGLTLQSYLDSVDVIMKDALLSVDLMKSSTDKKSYRRYFPHAVSHGLGLDVHESLGGYKELQAGMVLTVEPGIYIPEEGIGVRIEDDLVVTEKGYHNMTRDLSTDL